MLYVHVTVDRIGDKESQPTRQTMELFAFFPSSIACSFCFECRFFSIYSTIFFGLILCLLLSFSTNIQIEREKSEKGIVKYYFSWSVLFFFSHLWCDACNALNSINLFICEKQNILSDRDKNRFSLGPNCVICIDKQYLYIFS